VSAEVDDDIILERARGGDGDAFRQLTDPYRRELQMHCYRTLGSIQDAEDLLQETLVAAWSALDKFDGRSLRAWLYRIATNRCLNHLRASKRRGRTPKPSPQPRPTATSSSDPFWLEPYPEHLVEDLADTEPGPEARYDARESVSLSFICALQQLTPQQRSVLILRDVLRFSAAETADILDSSRASVNSSLQRARKDLPSQRDPALVPLPRSPQEAAIVDRFAKAIQSGDIDEDPEPADQRRSFHHAPGADRIPRAPGRRRLHATAPILEPAHHARPHSGERTAGLWLLPQRPQWSAVQSRRPPCSHVERRWHRPCHAFWRQIDHVSSRPAPDALSRRSEVKRALGICGNQAPEISVVDREISSS
jgi:RNA polymerase sigma factor (sigma-70 family)